MFAVITFKILFFFYNYYKTSKYKSVPICSLMSIIVFELQSFRVTMYFKKSTILLRYFYLRWILMIRLKRLEYVSRIKLWRKTPLRIEKIS